MKLNPRLRHEENHCLNCENTLSEDDNFCSKCSQKRTTGRISFGQLVIQFFEDTINWDARLFRSIRDLFFPGKLTNEYFKGRHVPYWQPLRLFLFMAALQMVVVGGTFNKVNSSVQKANESIKQDVYNYLLLKQLDTLKQDVVKDFSNKKLVNSAIDSLLAAYVHHERFQKNKVSKAILRTKQDSIIAVISAEMLKEDGKIDSTELAANVKDFTDGFLESFTKGRKNTFSVNMQSDSIEIPFVKVKNAFKPTIERDSLGNLKRVGWNIDTDGSSSDGNNASEKPKIAKINAKINGKEMPSLPISKLDFINLSADEIIAKYKVEGFSNQVIAKQTIKAMKDGKSGIDFFLSRLLWMMIIMMPIFALFLELVNRPYYYVEHVIFSFHCHAFMFFLISSIAFVSHYVVPAAWSSGFSSTVSTFVAFFLLFYFYKAMLNVYKQGYLKTFVKFIFLLFSYVFTLLIALFATMIVSFAFF